ncbi:MAG: SDR family NAD(P)-dependent oxidoreductase [Gemmatimonadota bacterium]|nr:SDR family NAD(P)-dependent oxidoreductase [Gemmatimonadota bacterium]
MQLEAKVALITGGSAGLGAALARRFAEEGAAVSICGRRPEPIEAVCREIEEIGGRCLGVAADVTDPEDVGRWLSLARAELGPIDALVNNASVLGERTSIEDYDLDTWRNVLEVNLTGAFVCAKAAVPYLRETGGSLINVSSGVGDHGRPYWGAYCVSKNGLEAMSELMAGELADDGIRVNAVDPGSMRTSMRAAAYPDEDPETLPEPGEVADVFVYLASDDSREVTGARFRAKEFDVAVR